MMAGHGDDISAVGGPIRHIPVLLAEVLEAVAPKAGDVIVDGTFGAGGYTKAILATGASVVAIDRDPDAIAAGGPSKQSAGSSGSFGRHSRLDEHVESADGVVLDIGISSMQIDQAERGTFIPRRWAARHAHGAVRAGAASINSFKVGDLAHLRIPAKSATPAHRA
jgi:16S rRNA (cytosine1402-N4)-methyltransferase